MVSKLVVVSAVILILIIAAGFLLYPHTSITKTTNNSLPANNSIQKSYKSPVEIFYQNLTTPFSDCDTKQSLSEREGCYITKALEKNDASICDYIILKEANYVYYSKRIECYARISNNLADPSICDKASNDSTLTDQKDKCYLQTVGRKLDSSICSNKISLQRNKDSCYQVIGSKTGNYEICNNIQDAHIKELCKEPLP